MATAVASYNEQMRIMLSENHYSVMKEFLSGSSISDDPDALLFANAFAKQCTLFTDALYTLVEQVWLDKAIGSQLDGIGEIVGQARTIPEAMYRAFFGYKGQTEARGYGQARYRRTGENPRSASTQLQDAEYRNVLNWKILHNRSSGLREEIHKAITLMLGAVERKIDYPQDRVVRIRLPSDVLSHGLGGIISNYIPVEASTGVLIESL